MSEVPLYQVRDRLRRESVECSMRAQELLEILLLGHMAVWMG